MKHVSTRAANPDTALSIDDVLLTDELLRRPSRKPDLAAENNALLFLGRAMAENRDGVLQAVAELILKLCRADSAGISMIDAGKEGAIFRWKAAAGEFADNPGEALPPKESPCGSVIDRNRWLLFREPARFFPAPRNVHPSIYEALLVPFH